MKFKAEWFRFTPGDMEYIEYSAKVAQSKFAAMVAKGKFDEWAAGLDVVYFNDEFDHLISKINKPEGFHTHSMKCFDIKPIEAEKCEHKSRIYGFDSEGCIAECRDCGKKLRPTGWEPVE